MAIVFTGNFYVQQSERSSGPQFSIHAYDTVDSNYSTNYEILGGSVVPYLDLDAGFMVFREDWLETYRGYEQGQILFDVTIKAIHAWFNWDTNEWVETTGTQTYTIEVTDVSPYPPVVYTPFGRVSEAAQTGDTVQTYGGEEWSFSRASISDGTGDSTAYLSDDAGGRFRLDLVDDKYVLKVADGALVDHTGWDSSSYTIVVAVNDGTTIVTESYQIVIDNEPPSVPVDIDGAPGATIVEHAPNGTAIGIHMDAVDPKGGAVTYSFDPYVNSWLGRGFEIDADTGVITVKDSTLVNYESFTDGKLTLRVIARDAFGMESSNDVHITVTDVNDAPVIADSLDFTLNENSKAVGMVVAIDEDVKPSPDTLTYSLSGTDAALFTIDAQGNISFKSNPNYEAPRDANKDNIYAFNVLVNDGTTTTSGAATVSVLDVNEEPVVGGSSVVTLNVAEGTATTSPIYQIVATDPEGQALSFTPANIEANFFFTIDAQGYVYFNDVPDFDEPADLNFDNRYEAIFVVSDGTHAIERTLNVNVTDVNYAPVITNYHGATALRLVDENWKYAIDFFSATDADGDALTWSISGADAALFTIDSQGVLRMKAPADFENPLDANKDNAYQVTVRVSDGTLSDSVAMTVRIEDLQDTAITKIVSNGGGDSGTITIAEGIRTVGTVSASGEKAVTYSLAGGTDAALFSIDKATGALTLKATPDFESPADADKDNSYAVIVKATDGLTSDQQALTVRITDVNEAPKILSNGGGSKATIAVKENMTGAVASVSAADPEKAKLTYSLSGTDSGDFRISSSGVLTFRSSPDFEKPLDANGDNKYLVTVKVSDGVNTTSQALTVDVGNVNEAPKILSNGGGSKATIAVKENMTGAVASMSAADPEKAKLTYSLSGTDSGDFKISSSGVLTFRSSPDFERPLDANGDNKYLVTVNVSDGVNKTSQALTVDVGNVAGKTLAGTGKVGVTLTGTGEEDKITGTSGNDTIRAGAGTDTISGGKGADQLYGGAKDLAHDIFVFKAGDSGTSTTTMDRVYDFERGIDKIDLSGIDADTASGIQDLRFVSKFTLAKANGPDGQFMVVDDGSHVRVHIDLNGDLKTDMMFQVTNVDTLARSDFLL
jgi:Ca2+-binding RTX toxin-like protein